MEIKLAAKGKEQQLLKAYLEQNASDTLAYKINNGVWIQKDGVRLLMKKDLDGFIKFAVDEAKKTADKGAAGACVADNVVFGWLMHYFEESSIEGMLYNEDGTPFILKRKEAPKSVPTPKAGPKPKAKPQGDTQQSIFDMMDEEAEGGMQTTLAIEDVAEASAAVELVEQAPAAMEPEPTPNTDTNIPDADEVSALMSEYANMDLPTVKESQLPKAEDDEPEEQAPQINPVYIRYLEAQREYPDAYIFYMMGDFYEIFGPNAVTLAKEFKLTLASRDFGLSERVPMLGFPFPTPRASISISFIAPEASR